MNHQYQELRGNIIIEPQSLKKKERKKSNFMTINFITLGEMDKFFKRVQATQEETDKLISPK